MPEGPNVQLQGSSAGTQGIFKHFMQFISAQEQEMMDNTPRQLQMQQMWMKDLKQKLWIQQSVRPDIQSKRLRGAQRSETFITNPRKNPSADSQEPTEPPNPNGSGKNSVLQSAWSGASCFLVHSSVQLIQFLIRGPGCHGNELRDLSASLAPNPQFVHRIKMWNWIDVIICKTSWPLGSSGRRWNWILFQLNW